MDGKASPLGKFCETYDPVGCQFKVYGNEFKVYPASKIRCFPLRLFNWLGLAAPVFALTHSGDFVGGYG